MRNFKSLPLLSLAILCSGALAGCGGSNSATFTISFDSQGGSAVSALTVAAGAVASKPADPTYEGHSFEGWFKDSYCTSAFDWASKITIDWTLYAGWSGGSSSTSSSSGGSSSTSTATSESGGTTSTSVAAAGTYYLDFSAVTWWADASAILNAHYWCATESENTTWPGTVMTSTSDYADLWYRQPMKWAQGAVAGDGSYTTSYNVTGSAKTVTWDDINATSLVAGAVEQAASSTSNYATIAKFGQLKSSSATLIRGSFADNGSAGSSLKFSRTLDGDTYYVTVDFQAMSASVSHNGAVVASY